MTSHIFISYARIDGASTAKWLADELSKHGYEVWMDRDLHSHKDFSAEIEQAIQEASHVIVCGSADVQREDSFVRKEVLFAQKFKKPIIPLMLPGGYLPITIISNTYIDFSDRQFGFQNLMMQLGHSVQVIEPLPQKSSLAGKYRISGNDPAQAGVYQGTMQISGSDPYYELHWDAGMPLRGHGVRVENVLAAVYLDTFSVAAYKIEKDGRLLGKFIDRSAGSNGREDAMPRKPGTGLVGEYDVLTITDEGREVEATLKIQPFVRNRGGLGGLLGGKVSVDNVYQMIWSWPHIQQTLQGVAFVVGEVLVSGFPNEPHGLVGYYLRPDGTFVGNWFGAGQVMLGSENAERA